MKYLVHTHHCDPKLRNALGVSPLHCASQNGDLVAMKYLIENLKCECECPDANGFVPLHHASYRGHLGAVEYLVRTHHCDLQVRDALARTPLHLAALNGHLQVLKFLIEDGMYECDSDNRGFGLLHYASSNGHLDVVEYLVNTQHCDPQAKSALGCSPLHFAAFHNHLEVLKFFIEDNGLTLLHVASQNGSLDVVKCLVGTHHCDPHLYTASGHVALELAAYNGHVEIVKHLLDSRAYEYNPDFMKWDIQKAIMGAEASGHSHVTSFLQSFTSSCK
jgi:ankyrin repeat protein